MRNPVPVVRNADKIRSTVFNFNDDIGRAGIERIFDQFLDHGRWALDDLSCGDLIGDMR